ncbi:MAG: NAD(P)-dependent oxidoreductase [Pseudomonadota bacterium]
MSDPSLPFDRVCVTGGSGLLGRFVVRELARDAEVLVMDIAPPVDEGFAFANVDVLDIDAVTAALKGQQAVVHLAALDDGVADNEEDYIKVNIQGTWNVLQAAEELGLERAVICSSTAAVGLSSDNPPAYLPVDVAHPAVPTGAYGLSKRTIELLAQGIVKRGKLEVVCLRPCLVAQADIVYSMAGIVAETDGLEPPPPATGAAWRELREGVSPTRAFVSPSDVARAFRAALAAPGLRYGVYFVTSSDTCTRLPTVEAVERGCGVVPDLKHAATYANDPRASAYDIASTREALGWEPNDTWEDYLAQVIQAG